MSERIASVWVLAALAAADADGPLPDELGAVLGAAGYAESSPEGWTLHPSYRMTGTSRSFARQVADTLRQAAAAAERLPETAKADDDLLADGELSGAQLARILDHLETTLPAFREALRRTGPRFLDIGVGVGGITRALLDRAPDASVVGLDIDERMLRLAGQELNRGGSSARVELRHQDATTLTDRHTFDLAWLPMVALSPDDVLAALPRIRTALRPGGWLVSATPLPVSGPGDVAGSSLHAAIVRWRTARRGVACWDATELASQLESAGYRDVHASRAETGGITSLAARAPR